MNKVYQMNENYFSEINSHEKAYILGFIYADGNIINNLEKTKYCLRIAQKGERKDVLEKIVKALNSNIPIKEYVPNVFSITLYSKQIANDLSLTYKQVEHRIYRYLNVLSNKKKKHILNEKFFKKDSHNKFYIIGLIAADGNLFNDYHKNKFKVSISSLFIL